MIINDRDDYETWSPYMKWDCDNPNLQSYDHHDHDHDGDDHYDGDD